MATTPPTPGKPLAEAAAAAITADPVTAELLRKHAAGQPLTPQESGKVGSIKAKLNKMFGKGNPVPGPAAPGPGQPAAVASVAPGQTSDGGLAVPAVDSDIVKRTTAAVLGSCDQVAQRYIAREARKVAADDRTTNRFIAAAALPGPTKDMMVETSPDVLAALGLDPKTYPLTVFVGSLGLWASNLWLCVDELKSMHAERGKQTAAAVAATPAPQAAPVVNTPFSTPTPATLPAPARPPNAPPEVMGKGAHQIAPKK